MGFDDVDLDRQLLTNPNLEPEKLAEIAARRPDLWAIIRAHPNVYPGLDAWIVQHSPAPALPTPPQTTPTPTPEPSSPASPKRKKPALWISLAVVAALVIGGGTWFMTQRQSNSPGTVYASLPTLTSAAAVGQPTKPITIIPMGQNASLTIGTTLVVAASVGGQEMLVGMEKDAVGLPLWVTTISSPVSQCGLQDEALICGDEEVDVSNGAVVPASSPTADTPDLEDTTSEPAAPDTNTPYIAGNTIIEADASGITATNAKNDKETWRIEAPVDSWFISDGTLIVGSAGAIYELSFPTKGQKDQEGTPVLDALDVPASPSYDQLSQMSLTVPEDCGHSVGLNEDPAKFNDGISENSNGSITLDAAEPMLAGGKAFTVAQLTCRFLYGGPRLYWAIYDADANLVTSDLMGKVPGFGMYEIPFGSSETSLSAAGAQFSYMLEDVAVLNGSADVTVTQAFDGAQAQEVDVVFHLPSAEMRAPDLQAVQELYDAVARGEEDLVADQISSEELDLIKNGTLGAPDSNIKYRDYLYPPGAKISNCVLATPTYRSGQMIVDDDGVGFYSTNESHWAKTFEPGTWLCGIRPLDENGQFRDLLEWRGPSTYIMSLRILTDADGTPLLLATDRTFS